MWSISSVVVRFDYLLLCTFNFARQVSSNKQFENMNKSSTWHWSTLLRRVSSSWYGLRAQVAHWSEVGWTWSFWLYRSPSPRPSSFGRDGRARRWVASGDTITHGTNTVAFITNITFFQVKLACNWTSRNENVFVILKEKSNCKRIWQSMTIVSILTVSRLPPFP